MEDINNGNSIIKCRELYHHKLSITTEPSEVDVNSFIEGCGDKLCKRFRNCLEDIKHIIIKHDVVNIQLVDFSKESYILLDRVFLKTVSGLENISTRINCCYRFYIKEPIGLEWGFGGNPHPDSLKDYNAWIKTAVIFKK